MVLCALGQGSHFHVINQFTTAAPLALLQQAPAEDTARDAEFGVEVKERDPATGEFPVDPYTMSNANAGAALYDSARLVKAFGGREVGVPFSAQNNLFAEIVPISGEVVTR